MRKSTKRGRMPRRALTLGLVLLACLAIALAAAGYAYSCGGGGGGTVRPAVDLRVARTPLGPWYDATSSPLTAEIPLVASNLYPGQSGTMVAYVMNSGSSDGAPSIAIGRLTDSGGQWTEPERTLEPKADTGNLSAVLDVTVTYTSSRQPLNTCVVAHGSLKALAQGGHQFTAPVLLRPSLVSPDIGTWRIAVRVPTSADDRIQGDTTACDFVFGLTQSGTGECRRP
jgi:hypothetical protein